jgi:hypothetical protein
MIVVLRAKQILAYRAYLLREQGVGSSNLPAPTNQINHLCFWPERELAFMLALSTGEKGARKYLAVLVFVEPGALDVEEFEAGHEAR